MFVMTAVALLCVVLLIGGLMREACRHRRDLWITTDDAILCVVSPAIILLGTFGATALGYRLTNGGLAAVSTGAWIGSAIIVAISVVIWIRAAAYLRESGRARAASVPSGSPLPT